VRFGSATETRSFASPKLWGVWPLHVQWVECVAAFSFSLDLDFNGYLPLHRPAANSLPQAG